MTGIGFSAPWVLLAALAVAGPIAAHLARHENREGRGFPSLMFLRRVPFPTRSRRKLADRILLALRVLAVASLVLSFARPYLLLEGPDAGLSQRARVVLLDRSYSMGIGKRFEKARRIAQQALRVDDDGTQVALVVFDESTSTLSDFAAGSTAAMQALQALSTGNRATNLSKALTHASRLLASVAVAKRELILISDLQRSGLGGELELASDIDLQVHRIDDEVTNNLGILAEWYEDREGSRDSPLSLHARIANTGSAALDSSLRVQVDGLHAAQQQVSLAPSASRDLVVPVFAARERPTRVQLALDDDALAVDNARYLVIAPTRTITVLWVGNSSRGNPYVNAALSSSPQYLGAQSLLSRGSQIRVQNVDVSSLDLRALEAADVIVLDGVIPEVSQFAAAIQRRVSQGAGLLTLPGGDSPLHEQSIGQSAARSADPLGPVLAGVPSAQQRARAGAGAGASGSERGTRLAVLAPEHAIATALGDASFSGIAVWWHRRLEPKRGDRVLARFEDGAPALLEREHGLGRSITLALSLEPQSSNLVLDPVFVPLLVETLLHLAQRRVARVYYEPGDVLDVAHYAGAVAGGDAVAAALRAQRAVQLRAPSGAVQQVLGDESFVLAETGFYELRVADAAPLPIAVNPVAAESLLDALSVAQLNTRLQRSDARVDTAQRGDTEQRRDTRIARWLLWLAIAALLAEALFAAWLARRRPPQRVAQEVAQRVAI